MSWEKYFKRNADGNYKYTYYNRKCPETLPDNLPMPPTTNLSGIFSYNHTLKDVAALSSWDVSKVSDMSCMFFNCEKLNDITGLANWDVSNVKDMTGMFCHCGRLYDISPLAKWDVTNNDKMDHMFSDSGIYIQSLLKPGIRCRNNDLLKCKYDVLWERAKTLKKENTELSAHIANLEEQIKCLEEQIIMLTETLEQTQKDEAKRWYQPIIELF